MSKPPQVVFPPTFREYTAEERAEWVAKHKRVFAVPRRTDEDALRKLLWLWHDPSHYGILYGDDGEMQCSACMLDFKRDSVETIEERFEERALQKLIESQKKG